MSEQSGLLDDFDEFSGRGRRNVVFYSVSPALERARPAREVPAAPSPAPKVVSAPVAPAVAPEPVLPRIVTTRDELLDLIRRRRDELGVTHMTIDALTGWASGYASKLLSPEPLRGLGADSLALVIGALALGIARVEFVEDPEQVERMRSRWAQRLRPPMRPRRTRGALLQAAAERSVCGTNTEMNDEAVRRADRPAG